MKIVADKAIPFVEPFFRTIGNVILCDGRQITPTILADADVLLVRTVTRVDKNLLEGTGIRFVATATSGQDHIDSDYLIHRNIGYAHAAGCNARSVAEYVLSSLFALASTKGFSLSGKTAGIIGYGHVGSAVRALLDCVGIRCLIHDPPLQARDNRLMFASIDEVLNADIVTIHVPLVSSGAYPTCDLVDTKFLAALRDDVILINTSRGEVVDEQAMSAFMAKSPNISVILDVWRNEPAINTGLMRQTSISTPHIASYSLDAKYRGTRMIYEQVCRYFNIEWKEYAVPDLPVSDLKIIDISENIGDLSAIQKAVLSSYDVRCDDALLRQIQLIPDENHGTYFAGLRNNYAVRRELTCRTVRLANTDRPVRDKLVRLGFTVE